LPFVQRSYSGAAKPHRGQAVEGSRAAAAQQVAKYHDAHILVGLVAERPGYPLADTAEAFGMSDLRRRDGFAISVCRFCAQRSEVRGFWWQLFQVEGNLRNQDRAGASHGGAAAPGRAAAVRDPLDGQQAMGDSRRFPVAHFACRVVPVFGFVGHGTAFAARLAAGRMDSRRGCRTCSEGPQCGVS
jgi:hypothetical protein